ncbi:MAG: hypothetical protein JWQ38_1453 [Flavipsychrobacter sp.]|nr:hypothetical protein [Flavipsychrobacter sp.]
MKKYCVVSLMLMVLLSSCATYHLSTESLLRQFANTQEEKKITVFIAPPFFVFPGVVDGNSLSAITVLDKKEQPHTFPVTRHMGVRITKNNGKRKTFYFNTLLLEDSTIVGSQTHFFNARIKPIKFADIKKIELQR